ncbi:MAG: amidohydrolase, partial [Pseudomonadota bacterium]|nr:amidohydrolase [Pseudomonadota bacterium]
MVNPAISCSAAAGTLLILALSGCQQQAAELVLQGGMIYTIRADQPIAEAIVVSAGKIVFVGDEATAATYIGSDTEVVDLEGRLLLPGLIDAHLHPLGGAVKELYQCNFPFSA